jgi:transposase
MRVVMEAGGSSQWVSRLIEGCGHEVVVCAPRRVRLIAESTLKSDEIDAEVLARLGRIDHGFLGRVTHRSEEAQQQRANLTVRSALVGSRARWINTVRGILRGFGYRVPGGRSKSFHDRCAKVALPEELRAAIQPLLSQLEMVSEEIERLEEELETIAAKLPIVQHLREIHGVGLLTALYFVLSVDDPERFRRSRDVAAFFGLRPCLRGSGDVKYYGKITKEGDPEMRRLLVQAAHAMMNTRKPCRLQQWAFEVERRRGKGKALTALARKIAVLMHRLWITGEAFEAFPHQKKA